MENASSSRPSRSTSHAACPVALRSNNRQQRSKALPKTALPVSGATMAVSDAAPQQPRLWASSCVGVDMPLAEAVRSAEEQDIKAMLDAARESGQLAGMLDERNLRRQAPLHFAAECGRCGVVQLLLDYGASVNAVDSRGETALHRASAGGHASSVQLLLERGALVLSDKQGQTALHRAASRGHAAAVAVMLRQVEPWFQTFAESFDRGEAEGGSTPLHIAIIAGHAEVVKAIMAGFSHDGEKLEKFAMAANRWGDVPADIVEGQAPIILTACVRETQRQRREAQQLMQKRATSEGETRRWCDMPMTPKLPSNLQRRMGQDARKRSQHAFEAVQKEVRSRKKIPVQAEVPVDSPAAEQAGVEGSRDLPGGDGWRTPETIRKTTMNFKLLADGDVDLDCIYQRAPAEGGPMGAGPQYAGTEPVVGSCDSGVEEQDMVSADCEFEFNFDLMDVRWDSPSDSEEEWGELE